jgi:hypothetical protein
MQRAPSPSSSTSRRSVLGLSRDAHLSAETIRRAQRDGWAVYWPADADAGVFDCTVTKPGFASDGAPGLISVWDNG